MASDDTTRRLAAFAGVGEIAWPAAEGIDHKGKRTRGWEGPYIAGTHMPVAVVGRNLDDDWDDWRVYYAPRDLTDAQLVATRDYYVAHRDLFQAQTWREARYDEEYRPGGNRLRLQADVRDLLAEVDRLRAIEAAAAGVLAAQGPYRFVPETPLGRLQAALADAAGAAGDGGAGR